MAVTAYAGVGRERMALIRKLREEAMRGLYGGEPWNIRYGDDGRVEYLAEASKDGDRLVGFLVALFLGALASAGRKPSEGTEGRYDEARKSLDEAWEKGRGLVNRYFDRYEGMKKAEAVDSSLGDARRLDKWIWLCSSHGDPAEGHREWQGRYYYDEGAPRDVIEWAESRGMRSYQWVMWAPVYMVTRPNCRHYFAPFTREYAESHTAGEAAKANGLHRDIGARGDRQTLPPHSGYGQRQRVYSERLRIHEAEYMAFPTKELEGLIEKDRQLLSVW